MSIGTNIRKLRLSRGLNQQEFAKKLGVSDKAVSTWENDIKTPRMGTIQKIADLFNIKKSQIIEEDITDNDIANIDVNDIRYAAYMELEGEDEEVIKDVIEFIKFKKQKNKKE